MPSPIHIELLETYRDIPIVELRYTEPTLLNLTSHEEQMQALLDLPYPRLAAVVSFENLSYASDYIPTNQARSFQSPLFQAFRERVVTLVRYQAGSLTSMIQTMSAHTLVRAGASNFAPDLNTALRAVRRTIDNVTVEHA